MALSFEFTWLHWAGLAMVGLCQVLAWWRYSTVKREIARERAEAKIAELTRERGEIAAEVEDLKAREAAAEARRRT